MTHLHDLRLAVPTLEPDDHARGPGRRAVRDLAAMPAHREDRLRGDEMTRVPARRPGCMVHTVLQAAT